jgi:hypothetical protein
MAASVFYPIVLEEMAARAGVDHLNHNLPCQINNNGYNCDIEIAGYFVNTSSAVFCRFWRSHSFNHNFSDYTVLLVHLSGSPCRSWVAPKNFPPWVRSCMFSV